MRGGTNGGDKSVTPEVTSQSTTLRTGQDLQSRLDDPDSINKVEDATRPVTKAATTDLIFGGSDRDSVVDQLVRRVQKLEAIAQMATGVQLSSSSSAPPPPTIVGTTDAGNATIRFTFRCVNNPLVKGYNVYRSNQFTNSAIAALVKTYPQPADASRATINHEDGSDTATEYAYWVCSFNSKGIESPRVLARPKASGTAGYLSADEINGSQPGDSGLSFGPDNLSILNSPGTKYLLIAIESSDITLTSTYAGHPYDLILNVENGLGRIVFTTSGVQIGTITNAGFNLQSGMKYMINNVDLHPGVTAGTVTLVKITGGGSNGSITFNAYGIVTAYTAPT